MILERATLHWNRRWVSNSWSFAFFFASIWFCFCSRTYFQESSQLFIWWGWFWPTCLAQKFFLLGECAVGRYGLLHSFQNATIHFDCVDIFIIMVFFQAVVLPFWNLSKRLGWHVRSKFGVPQGQGSVTFQCLKGWSNWSSQQFPFIFCTPAELWYKFNIYRRNI